MTARRLRESANPTKANNMIEKKILFRFAVFSDAHVTPVDNVSNSPFPVNRLSNQRYEHAVKCINQLDPELILNLGDMVHPLPGSKEYHSAAERYHQISSEFIQTPICIPGNHDVGDKPSEWMPAEAISERSLKKYHDNFGEDYRSFKYKGWTFILLNGELLNAPLSKANQQKIWFENELLKADNKKIFVAIHYPPFLYEPEEFDHYDNISEPDRSWFLELIEKYQVAAVFSGHVHNFWLNTYKTTDLFIIPSVSFVRQDYSEMYSSKPPFEGGREDVNKLGFLTFDVFEDDYIWRFHRTFGRSVSDAGKNHLLKSFHPQERKNPAFGVDLRLPWQEHRQIPPSGALDEFYRKDVRNDYPLLALCELGINELRMPLNDIYDSKVLNRLIALKKVGFTYTFYSFGIPHVKIVDLIKQYPELFDKIEIIWPGNDSKKIVNEYIEFRQQTKAKILISPLWKNFGETDKNGRHFHVIKHGFNPSKLETFEDFFPKNGIVLKQNLIFENEVTIATIETWRERHSFLLHVLSSSSPHNPSENIDNQTVIAESIENLWLKAKAVSEGVVFFTDAFVEIDRGYFRKAGLIDRLGNPMLAWHKIMTSK